DGGHFAADLFGVTESGTFEHGTSVLRLARDIDDAAPEIKARWAEVRRTLLEARAGRPQPARDDKVVAAWNGLAITALAEYASVARSAAPEEAARAARLATAAGDFLARVHVVGGRLRRVSRAGVVGEPAGVLEDYGCVAEAFCALHQLTGEGRWLTLAGTLLDAALDHFAAGDGAYFDTADDAEQLVARPADPTDNASPSGASALIAALVSYSALTGDTRYREEAERGLAALAQLIARHARFAGYSAAAAEALLAGPPEIAVVVDGAGSPAENPLVATAWRLAPPGAVIVAGHEDQAGVPLLAGRPAVGGAPTAYVCRGFVCHRPVTTVEELAEQLRPVGARGSSQA